MIRDKRCHHEKEKNVIHTAYACDFIHCTSESLSFFAAKSTILYTVSVKLRTNGFGIRGVTMKKKKTLSTQLTLVISFIVLLIVGVFWMANNTLLEKYYE